VRDAAKHVEGHFAVPKIGGGTRKTASGLYRILPAGELGQVRVPGGEARQDLAKLSLGFTLGDPNPTDDPFTADQPNIDPARQLRRAMRPRIRRKKFRMRLNTQRHLRHVLSGGITRQERWQLGATSRPFKSTALKMEKAYILHPVAAAGFGAAYGTAMGAELHAKRRQGETKAHHEKRQVRAALQGAAIGGGTLGLAAQWEHQNRQNNRMRYATGGYTHRSKTNGKPTVDETWQRGARKLRNKSPVWPKREPWASPMARLTGPKPTIGSRLGNLGRAAVRVAQHIRKQEDMTKGIIGASMRFGATELPKIAGAFARASHTGGAMIARTPIGRMGARLAAKPRVAAGLGAVREGGWKGAFSSPGYTAGNVAGHVIGGSRGRKIGSVLGTAGLTAEYFPDVYTAGHLSGALGDKQPKKPLRPPGQLRKAIAGSVINAMGHTGDFAIRAARRHKLATGIAAGLAIPSAYHAMKDHPDVRALTGAAAAGGAAALLSRGRALRAARQTSQAIYRTGLKDAVRQHAHVMAGGTPSPHLQAQARRVYNTVKGQALMRARAHRRTAIAGIRTPKLKVAGAAAAGAGIGAAIHERHTMPPLYQLAERQE
jgi:hypothetical protein